MSEQPKARWTTHRVFAGGQSFGIAIDRQATDPISAAFRARRFPLVGRLREWVARRLGRGSPVARLARSLVGPGHTVLDLGAHIGTFTLWAAARGCRVIAVEASPRNHAALAQSLSINGFDKVSLIQAAVSDREGTLDFCDHGPFGHVYSAAVDMPSVRVRATTVERILEELEIERVDFIKMDVEGSELRAIAGMRRLLTPAEAPPVVFESNGHTLGFYDLTARQLRGELAQLGYRLYLPRRGKLIRVPAGQVQPAVVVDYLAAKRPLSLAGWRQAAPLSEATLLKKVKHAASGSESERLHIAHELAEAPTSEARPFAGVLEGLKRDQSDRVRRAAA